MTSTGPESAGLIQPQRETRSSSLRNLVTNQSNPSSKSILGKADAAALITVNASPGEGGGVANRHTDRWARDIDTANASGAIWQPTDVLSSLNGSLARKQGVVLAEPAQQDFVYDSDGSLLDDGTRQFGWNAQGQCVTQSLANVTNAPATHPVSATHVYDWMGRRAISTFTRADGSTGQLLTVFDRYDPILEEDETGKQQAHVWGINRQGQGNGATLGSTLLWSITSTDSRTLFAKTDASGNVNAWYDEQQSQVAARTYSPFGEVLEESGEAWPVSFGFSTKREFGGLNDYGFRWYRAEFGAWLSSDPILENGGLNLQVVVGNNVINYEDILGLRPPSPQEAGTPVGYFTYPHGATPDQMAHIDHINQQNAGKPVHSHVRPWPSIMGSPFTLSPLEAASRLDGSYWYHKWNPFHPRWFNNDKCNKFVGDVLTASTWAQKPVIVIGGKPRYPTVSEWEHMGTHIPGYSRPHNNPKPGDVVNNGAHCGIMGNNGIWQASTRTHTVYLLTDPMALQHYNSGRTPIPIQKIKQ